MDTGIKQQKRKKNADYFKTNDSDTKRLGQGTHNGVLYYGASIKGKPCVITSDKELYLVSVDYMPPVPPSKKPTPIVIDEIRDKLGLPYLSPFDENAVDYKWRNSGIKAYFEGTIKPRSIKEIYQEIIEINRKHVYHYDTRDHSLCAIYIIASYCFTVFDHMARINIHGLTSSGKSTQCKIFKRLVFNAMWVSKSTDSNLFRSTESTAGTVIIDNFDHLGDDLKKATFQFVETGFDSEGTYRLTEREGVGFKTKKFSIFCPLIINSVIAFANEDAVNNRCILIRLEKTNKKMERVNRKSKDWERLRNEIRVYMMENWKTIETAYHKLDTEKLIGRDSDIWSPLLAVAKTINEECYNETLMLAKDKIEENKNLGFTEEINRLIISLILDEIGNAKTTTIKLHDLAMEMAFASEGLDRDDEKGLAYAKRRNKYYMKCLKNFLTSIPSIWKKENITRRQNYEHLFVVKPEILRVAEARGYMEEGQNGEPPTPSSPTSPCYPNSPKIPKLSEYVEKTVDIDKNKIKTVVQGDSTTNSGTLGRLGEQGYVGEVGYGTEKTSSPSICLDCGGGINPDVCIDGLCRGCQEKRDSGSE